MSCLSFNLKNHVTVIIDEFSVKNIEKLDYWRNCLKNRRQPHLFDLESDLEFSKSNKKKHTLSDAAVTFFSIEKILKVSVKTYINTKQKSGKTKK